MGSSKSLGVGPAVLVTAAFIGPGTVMAASSAGAKYGYVLLWAVGFSVFATIVLQEMAARLGIASGSGLSQAIKVSISNQLVRFLALGLVLLAILLGNSAYQTGNILGAAAGVISISSHGMDADGIASDRSVNETASEKASIESLVHQEILVFSIGAFALGVIWIGRFDILQTILVLLVGLMSGLFLIAAMHSGADWDGVARGFIPQIPEGSDWIVIGLIGTTVVPYNLFLHAGAAAQRWSGDSTKSSDVKEASSSCEVDMVRAIRSSRTDTIVSVLIGGLITSAILITASAAFHGSSSTDLKSVKDVAVQLEPALGSWSKTLFGLGLLAAGLTSAITAPVAAGYAASGCFGWPGKLSDWRFKVTASLVVLCGVYFAVKFGSSPKETIVLAQVANGLLLPIVAVGLLAMANDRTLMKDYCNRHVSNILAMVVILIVALIAINQFRKISISIEKLQNTGQSSVSAFESEFPSPIVRQQPTLTL